jgi:D-alanine-D-alanine ligase-like ATP-grasp enzyme
MNIALVYNLFREHMLAGHELDVIAEYDSEETIETLSAAIASGGHRVLRIEADLDVWENLKRCRSDIDLVFNVAEGADTESRESLVPLMCETLSIPYTGSGPLTLALCLDKPRTKQVLLSQGILTPAFEIVRTGAEPRCSGLPFPCIVKLAAEGSSMGIDEHSVVADDGALCEQVRRLQQRYPGKVLLIEQFIDGREFTVPVIGNDAPLVLPVIEVVFDELRAGMPRIVFFRPDEQYASVRDLMQATRRDREMRRHHHRAVCPAELDEPLASRIRCLALEVYGATGCRDWCRMEFRLSRDGQLYVLEVNPIAGIDPDYHFPVSARAMGIGYAELVNRIIDHAARRQGLKRP